MVTGKIELHLIGQHDQSTHGQGGGGSSPSKGALPSDGWPNKDREVKVVAEAKGRLFNRTVTIDDVPSKKVYEIEAADGTKLKAHVLAGKDNPQAIKETLNAMADQHDMYPSKPPRRALIVDDLNTSALLGPDGPRVGAWTYPEKGFRHSIFINSDNLFSDRFEKAIKEPESKGWFMDQANKTNPRNYLVTHEAGHQYDFMGNRNSAKALYENSSIQKHMSTYGKSLKEESYAESFAEWHTSKGKTTNPAAKAYAQHEGWFGTDGYSKPSLQGSGAMEFQNEEKDLELEKLAPRDGSILADTFDVEKGPIVIGDLPDRPVTSQEKEAADKLVKEIFKESELSSTGHIELVQTETIELTVTGDIELVNEPKDLKKIAIELGIIRESA